ncbi:MAG TPA: hypothetical protein VLA59_03515 [Patescibacteria group bacterium]|nr:hypothetical protein [Patescibacteria group bacterium]
MRRPIGPAARHLAAGVGLALALAACAAAPVPVPPVETTAAPTAAPASRAPSPSATRSPADGPRQSDLGTELDIGTLVGAAGDAVDEFASDGSSIIFASAAAPDVARDDAAPDLWRLTPGPSAEPELIWRNPARDHTLARVGGDAGAVAFVDMPLTGERAWTFRFMARHETEARILDEHPGDADVPSLVPSFSVGEDRVVWTAFDRGPAGPVSQLLEASPPTWEPRVVLERPATEAEFWLPSLSGSLVAFTEVRYAADRLSDERHVYLMDLGDPDGRRRLDTSGRATMSLIVPGAVLWKEADAGFNMFNWGRMYRFDLATEAITSVDSSPQEYVNYPSAGGRFVAWHGADSFALGVYDHLLDEPRIVERSGNDVSLLRPHLAGDLLVWMRVVGSGPDNRAELRYAFLPGAGELRR